MRSTEWFKKRTPSRPRELRARSISRGFSNAATGSCWEFAWLLTVTLRHLGLAARFACGYRVLLGDEQHNGSPPRFPDTVTLHAWSEAYIPGAGWIGLDPSMGTFVNESHIPLACAPEPRACFRSFPIASGDGEASPETRSESLRVRRLTPSQVSWPHTDTQWADIEALGRSPRQGPGAPGAEASASG